ncbi:unnamed protein product [Brassicogethes aeneus]|uniref:Uncharacterized protein n=1 Tax=Brassicogethes aeneus TaxID=1431903 RepID=A0A9P0FEG2_BRAAE|nr:unnamed protein product [Brassicogethes aeneus]
MQMQNLPNLEEKLNFLQKKLLSFEGYSDNQIKSLKQHFSRFKSIFRKNNNSWLEGTFDIPVVAQNRSGRPHKTFSECTERTKRKKTDEIRSFVVKEVIVHAAQVELNKSGQRDAAAILKDITTTSPTRVTKYKRALSESRSVKPASLTPLQALAMFIEADLTRRQYEVVRNTNKDFYPCYSLIQKAKRECYPPQEECRVSSTGAESNLQSLVDLTMKSLSIVLEEVLLTLKKHERDSLKLICKWGCDGSQQTQYKQKFENDANSDANIFQSCFVPLRLVCGENGAKIVWENPTPSSPRYCRPITEEEINYIGTSANSLKATKVFFNGKEFKVNYVFIMTMVDGKVCNAATGTKSTSRCYICGATSKDFNQFNFNKDINLKATEFGLSVLHARIRLFESVIHLTYKLPVKKYRERKSEEEKELEKERKLEIQARFRKEKGLLINMPKANFGNTNDGNTSRRFFEDPTLASEITGISYELIYRLKVILETISSGHLIDEKKFDKYAQDTARLYVKLYPWHPMTPTMHKILVHGAVIIKNAFLPIGQLSEEAAEARNKHFRNYRQNFARKFSRENYNRDVFNRLLLSSDPLLSSMRIVKKRKFNSFLPETIDLLLPAMPNVKDSDIKNFLDKDI